MNTRFSLVLAVTALIAGFSACSESDTVKTPQTNGLSGDISIGLVNPGTGWLASVGMEMQYGFEFALEEINNSQFDNANLKFIAEDDQSTVEGAVEAFNKLISEDGVSVIVGPASSSATEAAFPIAQENRVAAISATAAARGLSEIGEFVFRTILATDVLIRRGIEVTQAKLRYQSAAIIYDETDLFSADGAEVMRESLTANGVKILTVQSFQSGETDFSAQLARVKELNPDAIFVSALPPDKPAVLIQASQLNIPDAVSIIINTLTAADVQAAGEAAEGAIAFSSWDKMANTPGNQAFIQSYAEKYGIEPNTWAAQSYATVYILAEAISNGQATDAGAIRDALANIRDFDTILGSFSFDQNGDAVYDPIVLVVENGQLKVFE